MLTQRKAIKEELSRLCRLHVTLSALLEQSEQSEDQGESAAIHKRLEMLAQRIGELYVQRRGMKQTTIAPIAIAARSGTGLSMPIGANGTSRMLHAVP